MKTLTRILVISWLILLTGFIYLVDSERTVATDGDVAASIRAMGNVIVQRGGKVAELPPEKRGSARAAYALDFVWIEFSSSGSDITVKTTMRGTNGCFRARDEARMDSLLAQLVSQASKDSGIPMRVKPKQGGNTSMH